MNRFMADSVQRIYDWSSINTWKMPIYGSDVKISGTGQSMDAITGQKGVRESWHTMSTNCKNNSLRPPSIPSCASGTFLPYPFDTEPISKPMLKTPRLIPLSKMAERNARFLATKNTQTVIISNGNSLKSHSGRQYIQVRIPTEDPPWAATSCGMCTSELVFTIPQFKVLTGNTFEVNKNREISKICQEFSPELHAALQGMVDFGDLDGLEKELEESFKNTHDHCWRGGTIKSSFVYLLLDPRITLNMPLRAKNLDEKEVFHTFVNAIFYVGKGKRGRTYDHLYHALSHMHRPGSKVGENIQHILEIWNEKLGVISIQCYHNTIAVEAYTREACIIDAIGLAKLSNKRRGHYYGKAVNWSQATRRVFGVHLLQRALQIFLSEGERQIGPMDICN